MTTPTTTGRPVPIGTGSMGGLAALTFRPEAVAEPRYTGLLTVAPRAVGDVQAVLERFADYRAQLSGLVRNVVTLYETAERLPTFRPGDDAIRPGGYISGPTQFAIADGALWYLVFAAIGRVEPMALTSELSIRFLRPAIGAVLWARATQEVAGRRQVVGSVRIWTDDNEQRPCAVAQGTYVLPTTPTPPT